MRFIFQILGFELVIIAFQRFGKRKNNRRAPLIRSSIYQISDTLLMSIVH